MLICVLDLDNLTWLVWLCLTLVGVCCFWLLFATADFFGFCVVVFVCLGTC